MSELEILRAQNAFLKAELDKAMKKAVIYQQAYIFLDGFKTQVGVTLGKVLKIVSPQTPPDDGWSIFSAFQFLTKMYTTQVQSQAAIDGLRTFAADMATATHMLQVDLMPLADALARENAELQNDQ